MRTTPLSSKSIPLIAESSLAPGATDAAILGMRGLRNWWGRQKHTIVAPLTASVMSGTATTFSVNLAPFRYLTFSCSLLMICVSGTPSIISSCTYMRTSLSKTGWRSAFWPRMRTSAEPKLPDPTIAIFSAPAAAAKPRRETVSAERNMEVSSAGQGAGQQRLSRGETDDSLGSLREWAEGPRRRRRSGLPCSKDAAQLWTRWGDHVRVH
jgi:hypothetical protein